jgi:hypothetical protein
VYSRCISIFSYNVFCVIFQILLNKIHESRLEILSVAWEHARILEISPTQMYHIFTNKKFDTMGGYPVCFGERSTASYVSDICSDSNDPFHYLEYYFSEYIECTELKQATLLHSLGLTLQN